MEPNLALAVTPEALLEMALTKEKSAYGFYDQMLRHASVGLVRELIEFLKGEELKHVRQVERKLVDFHNERL